MREYRIGRLNGRFVVTWWAAEAGVPMDEISQYLGHSNVQITAAVYARFSPQHLSKAAEALNFGGPRQVQ